MDNSFLQRPLVGDNILRDSISFIFSTRKRTPACTGSQLMLQGGWV